MCVQIIIGILHDVEFNFGALGFNVELEEGGMFERGTVLFRFRGASLHETGASVTRKLLSAGKSEWLSCGWFKLQIW